MSPPVSVLLQQWKLKPVFLDYSPSSSWQSHCLHAGSVQLWHMGHDVQLILAALGKHLKIKQEILSRKVTIFLLPLCKTWVMAPHHLLFISDAIKCVYLTRDFPWAERCLCHFLLSQTPEPHFLGKTSKGCHSQMRQCIYVQIYRCIHTLMCTSL